MIRFIDLSDAYWTDPEENGGPICAFLSTVDDTFIKNTDGTQVFQSLKEILQNKELGKRMAGLVPDGFFNRLSHRLPIKETITWKDSETGIEYKFIPGSGIRYKSHSGSWDRFETHVPLIRRFFELESQLKKRNQK